MAIQLDGTTGISTSGNITAAGTLVVGVFNPTSISATGNVSGTNLNTNGNLSVGGNTIVAGDLTVVGNASLSGNIIGDKITNGNTSVEIPVVNGNVSFIIGGLSNVIVVSTTGEYVTGEISATGNITGSNLNATGLSLVSNVLSAINSTFAITTSANISANNVVATNHINASGNISGNNLTASGAMSATGNATAGNILTPGVLSSAGNITGGNIVTIGLISAGGNITGINITTPGTVSSGGNVVSGNVLTSGLISATANITSAANITGGNILSNGIVSVAGNVIALGLVNANANSSIDFFNGGTYSANIIFFQQGANGNVTIRVGESITEAPGTFGLFSTGQIGATSNIIGGNLTTAGAVSASGNVIGGNLTTAGAVSASGNVIGGNVNTNKVVGTGLTLVSTGDLTLSATGNINVNNEYINNLAEPLQNQDAATKLYVDNAVTTGFTFHEPVFAATATTLATATSGVITYTQPNGVANGIGATLTTTGSFNLIDSANIQTIGTRVLVKDQANAVQNGVYVWANATAIVRSTDADQYGSASTEAFGLNDYFFVQSGNVNAGAAYIVSAPAGVITFGTSNISFAEFSKSQVYTANTSAGISLAGTVINALVDNVTTAFSSGNIIVKTGAILTTPNIGAATGTSLSTTGNITGGNLSGTSIVGTLTTAAQTNITSVGTLGSLAVTGNATGGNILTGGIVSATGNISGNYFLGNGSQLTGIDATSIQNGTSNVRVVSSGGNVTVSVGGTGNVAVWATTGQYITGLLSASGNITGGNLPLALNSQVVILQVVIY